MSRLTDQTYLTQAQYKDSGNLNARLAIHQRFSTNSYGWFNWLFDQLIELPVNANILELGCGTGELWKESASRIPEGWALTLTDLSDGMLDAAWRNLIVIKRGIKFERVDVQSIPYADKAFDAVIANYMLYHVPDRKKALAEIRRVLKDDGVLFAATSGRNHMREMYEWIARVSGGNAGEFALQFTLENGKDQLQEFFPRVELSHYPDGLRVTDVDVILAYVRSMASVGRLSAEEMTRLEVELRENLAMDGAIQISKDAGLFRAIK
ncbi:MAG TPA: class I SAM-dependent methyltransferase [Anaerolineales bacterium]|nr:class I SAM-dependent methyltransferase [Anaerolineales bacterium]HNA89122.1 class I SAM-dependent methyltransferase [Anaerolineales bacterium]HNB37109.1 class I SAM-dependent methyltransferase [Anaerolineales bacterium]HNC09313.1 class I SAM-dependent methyltransferase [Anaerolineales bacterium]